MASQSGNRPTRRGTSAPLTTSQTEQYLLNLSFDEYHQLLMLGLLAFNPVAVGPDGSTPGRMDRVQIDDTTGGLLVKLTSADVTINASDIEIGAVELKNGATDDRAYISPLGQVAMLDINKQNALPYAEILTASATITPTTGKKIKILKVQVLQSPDNTVANAVTLNFASLGDIVTGWAYSDSNEWIGATDEVLNIVLGGVNPVSVNIRYKEIT